MKTKTKKSLIPIKRTKPYFVLILILLSNGCLKFSEDPPTAHQNLASQNNKSFKPPLTYKLDLVHKLQIDLDNVVKHPERYSAIKIHTSQNDQRYISLKSKKEKLGKISIQANGSSKKYKITYYKKNGYIFTKEYNE